MRADALLTVPETDRFRDAPGLYGELIAVQPWQEFATLTYAEGCRASEKVERDLMSWLYVRAWYRAEQYGDAEPEGWEQRDAYGNFLRGGLRARGRWQQRWGRRKDRPVYVLAVEPHKSRLLHGHALIWWPPYYGKMQRKFGWQLWAKGDERFDRRGFCRVEPPRGNRSVAAYVSKYITKYGDWVLSPNYRALFGALASA